MPNTVVGRVADTVYAGSETRLIVALDEGETRDRTPAARPARSCLWGACSAGLASGRSGSGAMNAKGTAGMTAITAPAVPLRQRLLRPNALWLAAPGIAFLAIFFLYPVLRLLSLSVQDPASGALSVATYARIANTDVYLQVLGITFKIAATRPCSRSCSAIPWPIGWQGCGTDCESAWCFS